MTNKPLSYILFFSLIALLSQSCVHLGDVPIKPDPSLLELNSKPGKPKISYKIYPVGKHFSGFSQPSMNYGNALEAMLDCSRKYGIADIKQSNFAEQGYVHIDIYPMKPELAGVSRFTAYPHIHVFILSLGFFPLYIKEIQPFEIHIIDPRQDEENRITVLRYEHNIKLLAWTPIALFQEDKKEKKIPNYCSHTSDSVMGRILDKVFSELTKQD